MLSAEEKINILASGKLAIVNNVNAAIGAENKGKDSMAYWTNAWNAISVHDTIVHPDLSLTLNQINALYEKLLDFKYKILN